jgi:nucleolar protein 15
MPKKYKWVSESNPNTSENSMGSQGPTPVCTQTFLERQNPEVAELNDNNGEIVFKQPISSIKEEI